MFLKKMKMRSQLVLMMVLVLLLSGVSIFTALYSAGKIGTRADTIGQTLDLDKIVQARSETATACNKNDTNCSYQVSLGDIRSMTVANPVIAANLTQATSEAAICIYDATKKKTPAELFDKSFTGIGWEGAVCSFNIKKINDTEISISLNIKNNQNIASNFPIVYKSAAVFEDFQGDEKLTNGNIKYNFTNLTFKDKYQNNKWILGTANTSSTSSSGSISAAYEVSFNGEQNLLSYVLDQYPDFTLNSSSFWKFTTTGTLKGSIDMDWVSEVGKEAKNNIRSATFCPDGCKVTLNEEMDIKAQKKGIKDNIKGSITSKANHQETYLGTGAVDPITHKIYWQDLTVNKNDNRSWSHDLIYSGNTKVKYSGTTSSQADVKPIKNTSTVTSLIHKSNQISMEIPVNKINPLPTPSTVTYGADINKNEKTVNTNLVSRTGTGSFSASNGATYGGIYNKTNASLLVQNSSNKNWIGTRRDPFSESPIPTYSPEYFPGGSLRVPGYFTATSTDATKTVLSTPAQKALPKNFVFLESFADDDKTWTATDKKLIDKLMSDLQTRNVNVTTLSTKSKPEMLDQLALIPSGSWVLNAGHGRPDGLNAGEDFVSYAEIMKVLKEKQIKIDVYAANSCFGGRAPLSQVVIGSMGIGYANITGSNLQPVGNLFGIGGSLWNATTNDIVAVLDKIAKQNTTTATIILPPWILRR